MKYETAGDPMSSLKWTRKTTQKIAAALDTIDIKVSKTTVGKILKYLGFSLKTNIKRISNGGKALTKKEKENRNKQFEYINGKGNVVSLLFYFVVVYSTFRVQMVKYCFAHILQRRICLNPSHGSADG